MSKEEKKPKTKKAATKKEAKPKVKKETTKAKPAVKKEKAPAKAKTTKPKPDVKETKPVETKPVETKDRPRPENTIFVGNKPAMTYVLAVMTCFNESNAKEVRICARGRAISSAVDVAELTRNRFLPDLKVKSILTSTEKVMRREGGGEANVSAIEIILSK